MGYKASALNYMLVRYERILVLGNEVLSLSQRFENLIDRTHESTGRKVVGPY